MVFGSGLTNVCLQLLPAHSLSIQRNAKNPWCVQSKKCKEHDFHSHTYGQKKSWEIVGIPMFALSFSHFIQFSCIIKKIAKFH